MDERNNDSDDGTVILPSGFRRASQGSGPRPPLPDFSLPAAAVQAIGNALPVGTRLGEFELTRVIGEGGFGIVYEAYDASLERRVAIKEYMPAELAERTSGMLVRSLSEDDEEVYRKGLLSFITEAKILARFDNASLVKVYRFWEANGTAYMVMPFYEGPTLLDALRQLRSPPDEDWLRRLLDPLTQALAVIHDEQVFHRDISPDNILLLAGTGRPLLLDFGAARQVINDANQKAPTAIVKPGYAPVEQYSDVQMKQGPWSDLYALAAVLHYAITGRKPPAAIARLVGDAYVPLVTEAAGRYSPALLSAIDKALIVKPTERTQNMDEFRAQLGFAPLARDANGALVSTGSAPAGFDTGAVADAHAPPTIKSRAAVAVTVSSRPPALTGRMVGLSALAAALLLAAGGVWWWLSRDEPVPTLPPGSGPAAVQTPPVAPPAANDADTAPPGTAGASAAAPEPPFSVVGEFARIQAQSTPGYSVAVQWAKPTFRIKDQDLLAMNVTSNQDGYLYVLGFTPDNLLFQYFPNTVSRDNFVKKQHTQKIPRTVTDPETKMVHDGIVLTDPPGKGHVLVIVSKYPRDFGSLGNKREAIYPLYPVGSEAEWLHRQLGGPHSIYLGQVVCPQGLACEDQFGATTGAFDIVP